MEDVLHSLSICELLIDHILYTTSHGHLLC